MDKDSMDKNSIEEYQNNLDGTLKELSDLTTAISNKIFNNSPTPEKLKEPLVPENKLVQIRNKIKSVNDDLKRIREALDLI